MGKYDALGRWLRAQPGATIVVSFDEIDAIVGGLPASAHSHRAWWANEADGRHVQARGWLAAGWAGDEVNQTARWVRFRASGVS